MGLLRRPRWTWTRFFVGLGVVALIASACSPMCCCASPALGPAELASKGGQLVVARTIWSAIVFLQRFYTRRRHKQFKWRVRAAWRRTIIILCRPMLTLPRPLWLLSCSLLRAFSWLPR